MNGTIVIDPKASEFQQAAKNLLDHPNVESLGTNLANVVKHAAGKSALGNFPGYDAKSGTPEKQRSQKLAQNIRQLKK